MAAFLVESQHTARKCVWALTEVLRQKPESLEHYHWGCKDGTHIGWAIVEADTKFDVLANVPPVLRSQTRIVQLNQFTPDEIMSFHEGQLSATEDLVSTS